MRQTVITRLDPGRSANVCPIRVPSDRLGLRVNPRAAVRPAEQFIRLLVADHPLLPRVPGKRPAELLRDVGQDAARGRDVALLDVGYGATTRGDVLEQVLHVVADGR